MNDYVSNRLYSMLFCGNANIHLYSVFKFMHYVYIQVVTPGDTLGPGQIYDSNRSTLLASLTEQGFPAADLGVARDDRQSLVKCIKEGLASHDVLITTGGVSMGEKVMY